MPSKILQFEKLSVSFYVHKAISHISNPLYLTPQHPPKPGDRRERGGGISNIQVSAFSRQMYELSEHSPRSHMRGQKSNKDYVRSGHTSVTRNCEHRIWKFRRPVLSCPRPHSICIPIHTLHRIYKHCDYILHNHATLTMYPNTKEAQNIIGGPKCHI